MCTLVSRAAEGRVGASAADVRLTADIGENPDMTTNDGTEAAAGIEIQILIEDEQELTAKELAQERKAALDEHKRLTWLRQTPEQLAGRIPVSVFAMGDLAAAA